MWVVGSVEYKNGKLIKKMASMQVIGEMETNPSHDFQCLDCGYQSPTLMWHEFAEKDKCDECKSENVITVPIGAMAILSLEDDAPEETR